MSYARHPRVNPPTLGRALQIRNSPLRTVCRETTVGEAVQQLAEGDIETLAVIDAEQLCGVFGHRDLVRFLAQGGSLQSPVSAAMRAPPPPAQTQELLEDWLEKDGSDVYLLPVFANGQLHGLLSRADLLAASDNYHRRVFAERLLDERIMFKRGTYSC